MKNLIGLGLAVSMAVASTACGSSPADTSNTLHVTGSVDTQYRSLDNARAIALGSDGRAFSAYLTQTGRFTLDLPVGHVYRIVIANATMSGELRMIGHLVNTTSDGKSASIAAKQGGSIRLGALRPANVAAASTTHTACECPDSKDTGDKSADGYGGDKGSADTGDKSGDDYGDKSGKSGDDGDKSGKSGGDDGGDDYKCEQKDADKDKTCDDGDDVDLEPEYAPGDKCKADADADEPAPAPKASSCSSKDGDGDGKDDGAADSKGGDDDKGTYGGKDDGADDSSSKDDSSKDDGTYGGGDKGGASAGSCTCSLECGAGSSCVASKCTTAAPTK